MEMEKMNPEIQQKRELGDYEWFGRNGLWEEMEDARTRVENEHPARINADSARTGGCT